MDQSQQGSQPRFKVMALGLTAILVFLSAVGLFLYLKPGADSPLPEELPVFVAGPLEGFELETASYFELEHVYIVRMAGGGILALYDLGPGSQAGVKQGDESALDCRIQFIEDENGANGLGDPPKGFEEMVFWDACLGNAWDAAGRYLKGPVSGDLDRFPVGVADEAVQVDVNNRRCMNQISQAAPCIPTQ